ncbi:MAG: glycosyltransferase family 2 protein [Candidatus Paceibacterota bacterium]
MGNSKQLVSVIIPCRNEERFIGNCLDSVLMQNYPKDEMEILVVDGMSVDGTRKIIMDYVNKSAFVKLWDNPQKIVPTAMNIGIKNCLGKIIIRMDAHVRYPQDYIEKCVQYVKGHDVDNVGGVCLTLPGSKTLIAEAVALSLASSFGVGNALFRIGVKRPSFVDTVPFGCYKREIFERVGLFDEDLVRNQDDEFNARLIKNGGKILLAPDIVSYYYARETYDKLWKMYYQYGYFKPLAVMKIKGIFTLRQLVPGIFLGSLVIFGLAGFFNRHAFLLLLVESIVYVVANFIFSFLIAVKNKMVLLPYLMIAFVVLHLSYGVGYLKGILDFMVFRKHLRGKIKEMPITR